MLDKVKKVLFTSYWSEEEKGVFLSGFDQYHDLIVSQGVLTSDMSLHELLDTLYAEIENEMKNIIYISIDIVSEIIQLENAWDILDKDPKEFWFAVLWEGEKSGVILPWTAGVADAKHALHNVKKKYGIEGNVEVFIFRT